MTEKQRLADNYNHEEDFIIHLACGECGYSGEALDDEDSTCPSCESEEATPTTSHEGCVCPMCETLIDMWVDGYRADETSELICERCFNTLPEQADLDLEAELMAEPPTPMELLNRGIDLLEHLTSTQAELVGEQGQQLLNDLKAYKEA